MNCQNISETAIWLPEYTIFVCVWLMLGVIGVALAGLTRRKDESVDEIVSGYIFMSIFGVYSLTLGCLSFISYLEDKPYGTGQSSIWCW